MNAVKLKNQKIYTAIIEYARENKKVHFIATQHIGSEKYYETLQKKIESIDIGLYESVFDENLKMEDLTVDEQIQLELIQPDNLIRPLIKILDCKYQPAQIIYPQGWKKCDTSLKDFFNSISVADKLKRGKSQLKIASGLECLYETNPENAKQLAKFGLKIVTLATAFAKYLPSKTPSFEKTINDRDFLTYSELNSWMSSEKTEIGIIYGFNHFKRINKYLKENQFEIENVEWIEALNLETKGTFKLLINTLSDATLEKNIRSRYDNKMISILEKYHRE